MNTLTQIVCTLYIQNIYRLLHILSLIVIVIRMENYEIMFEAKQWGMVKAGEGSSQQH